MFKQNVDLIIREKEESCYTLYSDIRNMITRLTSKVLTIENNSNTLSNVFMHIREVYPSSTSGMTSTTNGTTTRALNAVMFNNIDNALLDTSTNVITLPIGTYIIHGYGEGFSVLKHRVSFTSLDNDTMKYLGSSAHAVNAATPSLLFAIVEVTEPMRFILNHYTETAVVSGLGAPCNDGYDEVYAELFITKIK